MKNVVAVNAGTVNVAAVNATVDNVVFDKTTADNTVDTVKTTDSITITKKTTLGELIAILGAVKKAEKTPTAKKLREEAGEPIAVEGKTMVYANGYAVYDNGYARTVVWVPGCVSFTYYFNKLKPNEKTYGISETYQLPEGFLESQPWLIAVALIAEHRIEDNMMNRTGSRLGTKDYDSYDYDDKDGDKEEAMDEMYKKEYDWQEERYGGNPEDAVIDEENRFELLKRMTKKQREVFLLYYQQGYTQREIADILGITQQTVGGHLSDAVERMKRYGKK